MSGFSWRGALAGAAALVALFGVDSPARALTAFGITYDLQGLSGLSTTTAFFNLHITGINGPADTEGGASAWNPLPSPNRATSLRPPLPQALPLWTVV